MLDQEIQAICKEKIEKLLEADLTEQMQRLASSKENSSPAPFKESMTVAEAMEMVVAGHAFTDVWCAFLKRVCARDPMAIAQAYVVAQISTELVTELSATDPEFAILLDDLARLKRSRPTLQSFKVPDYGPKVQRDWLAKCVKSLVRYVELVGEEYRSHAKRPDLYAAPPTYRWIRRAAKLAPLSGSNIDEWGWCIWRAFQDLGYLEGIDGDGPSKIRKKMMRKLQALAAPSKKSPRARRFFFIPFLDQK
jgi:hypothetical protein